jgi:hypothetical protein
MADRSSDSVRAVAVIRGQKTALHKAFDFVEADLKGNDAKPTSAPGTGRAHPFSG